MTREQATQVTGRTTRHRALRSAHHPSDECWGGGTLERTHFELIGSPLVVRTTSGIPVDWLARDLWVRAESWDR